MSEIELSEPIRRMLAIRSAPPEVVSVSRRYQVLGRLGQGGMGEILLARQNGSAGFSREVVIKRLRPRLAAEPDAVAAFVDEARLLARLSHPNVCQVIDLVAQGGQLYLAMEYLDGLPLSDLWRRGQALDSRLVCGIAGQALEGLSYVHGLKSPGGQPAGVVHRDVSPENLFLTVAGAVKILDFGIAKTHDSAERTPFGRVKGKLGYMSPEQLSGLALDPRTDLYSLGVVLREALGGDDDASAGPLGQVIDRAAALDRDERYGSAREMRAAVDAVAARLGGAATPSELADWMASEFGPELAARRAQAARVATATETAEARTTLDPVEPRAMTAVTGARRSHQHGTEPLVPPTDERIGGGMVAGAGVAARVEMGDGETRTWRRQAAAAGPSAAAAGPSAAAAGPSASPGPHPLAAPAPGPHPLAAPVPGPHPLAAPAPGPHPLAAPGPGPHPLAAPTPGSRRPRRWIAAALAMAAAVALAVVLAGLLVARSDPQADAAGAVTGARSATEPATSVADPPAATAQARGPAAPAAASPVSLPPPRSAERPSAAAAAAAAAAAPHHHAPPQSRAPGYLSVLSRPYASIRLDGRDLGMTPLWRTAVPSGRHRVEAVTADGRRRTMTIEVRPGADLRRRLSWDAP